jgi:acyl-CoA reductase-like NAD-dependent aldehyde dehydrogenase
MRIDPNSNFTMSRTLQPIREASIDGRLQNIIYRQTQLEKLQKSLLDNFELIEKAIKNDTGHSDAEVAVEFILALQSLKEYYHSIDAEDALHKEYAIARGEDAPGRQEPIGIVYIVPSSYTAFCSVIVAVSVAVAAGNCVVIEVCVFLVVFTFQPVLNIYRSSLETHYKKSLPCFGNF